METSGVLGNRVLLRLRKVTATRRLKADHSLSQSHQAQHTAEHKEVKHRQAWTKEKIREVIWCYITLHKGDSDDDDDDDNK
jgi:hypothetical protein